MKNQILHGDSEQILQTISTESVHLVVTSPPYFNAREYVHYNSYQEYLNKLESIIQQCYRVLMEGRFIAINIAPVLIERESRSKSSTRIAIPFDIHHLCIKNDFEFMEDIIWKKPEGSGWDTSRGRRFSRDRQPLQYKTVPITEYILVYRKKTDKLIDWNIQQYDNQTIEESKIPNYYEKTNIWELSPASSTIHPAIFPIELPLKLIEYYSFKGDIVLDPFAGIGTTAKAALTLGRKYIIIEQDKTYYDQCRKDLIFPFEEENENNICM